MSTIFNKIFAVMLVLTLSNAFANKDKQVASVVVGSNGETTYSYANDSDMEQKGSLGGTPVFYQKKGSKDSMIQQGSLGGTPVFYQKKESREK